MIFFQNPDQAPSAIAHEAPIQRAEASEMSDAGANVRDEASWYVSERRLLSIRSPGG
jgi:hypothetical protein